MCGFRTAIRKNYHFEKYLKLAWTKIRVTELL